MDIFLEGWWSLLGVQKEKLLLHNSFSPLSPGAYTSPAVSVITSERVPQDLLPDGCTRLWL